MKVKVGIGDDAGRVAAVRAAVGPGRWRSASTPTAPGPTLDEALANLRALAPAGLEYAEEPVHGVDALRAVRAARVVPVAMDETAAEPGAVGVGRGRRGLPEDRPLRRDHGRAARRARRRARRAATVYVASTFDGPLGDRGRACTRRRRCARAACRVRAGDARRVRRARGRARAAAGRDRRAGGPGPARRRRRRTASRAARLESRPSTDDRSRVASSSTTASGASSCTAWPAPGDDVQPRVAAAPPPSAPRSRGTSRRAPPRRARPASPARPAGPTAAASRPCRARAAPRRARPRCCAAGRRRRARRPRAACRRTAAAPPHSRTNASIPIASMRSASAASSAARRRALGRVGEPRARADQDEPLDARAERERRVQRDPAAHRVAGERERRAGAARAGRRRRPRTRRAGARRSRRGRAGPARAPGTVPRARGAIGCQLRPVWVKPWSRTRSAGIAPRTMTAIDTYLNLRAFVDELVRCGAARGVHVAGLALDAARALARARRGGCARPRTSTSAAAASSRSGSAKASGLPGRAGLHVGHRGRELRAGGDRGARGARAAARPHRRPAARAARASAPGRRSTRSSSTAAPRSGSSRSTTTRRRPSGSAGCASSPAARSGPRSRAGRARCT